MNKKAFLTGMLLTAVLGVQALAALEALALTITPGKNWTVTTWLFVYPLKHEPQLAAWVEKPDGSFVQTIMVTASAARNQWRGNPAGGRPDSLPVWYYASGRGGIPVSPDSPTSSDVDATSSATPTGAVSLSATADRLISGERYILRLEVNHSFDYNRVWPKNARKNDSSFSGVNGQPSLVYSAEFIAGSGLPVILTPVGTGSLDGSHGRVTDGTAGLTTALEIIGEATVVSR